MELSTSEIFDRFKKHVLLSKDVSDLGLMNASNYIQVDRNLFSRFLRDIIVGEPKLLISTSSDHRDFHVSVEIDGIEVCTVL